MCKLNELELMCFTHSTVFSVETLGQNYIINDIAFKVSNWKNYHKYWSKYNEILTTIHEISSVIGRVSHQKTVLGSIHVSCA